MGKTEFCFGVLPMKSLMKKIDIFCYKHPRFGIPNLMLYVVVGNAVVWLFTLMVFLDSSSSFSSRSFSAFQMLFAV